MPTKAREQISACLDSFQQHEPVDRAAGAMGNAIFNADHNGRTRGAFNDARCEDADDPAVPAVSINDEQASIGQFRIGCETLFDGGEGNRFRIAAFTIEPLKLVGQLTRAAEIARTEELDD